MADINAKGGVLGQKLVLNIGDDACDPKQAVSVANEFASKKVVFVAGHFCSGSSIPASKVYTEEGILQITPASTNPKFTDEGSWNTFRTCGRDDQQGAVAGAYIAKELQGPQDRDPARQLGLRQRPRRRDQEGAEQGRREGNRCIRPIRRARRTIPPSSAG